MQVILPFANLAGYFFPNIKVKFFDESVVFEKGNELSGGDVTKLRVKPSYKRFRAGKERYFSGYVEFGLVIDFELVLFDSLVESFDKLLLKHFPLMELVIVNFDGLGVGVADHVDCHLGTVKPSFDWQ